jgi:hypothetical protein
MNWTSYNPSVDHDSQRCKILLDHAAKAYSQIVDEQNAAQLDIAKERTQFFEKIALGAGATIAAIVSFVGSRSGHLQPPWLLRAALVSLVLSMVGALLRNWRYPFYLLSTFTGRKLVAAMNYNKRKADLIATGVMGDIETGRRIDPRQWMKEHASQIDIGDDSVDEAQKQSDGLYNNIRVIEMLTLGLSLLGIAMLIALAWVNF